MFQSFEETADPTKGPERLEALRAEMSRAGVDGFLVPRADAHQGEYVADADARLAWLTGFTGSAGFAVVLQDKAGVFVDSRYRVQVRSQVADVFTPVDWPETSLAAWLKAEAPGAAVAYDPWLHTLAQIREAEAALEGTAVSLVPSENLIDRIWSDRPAPPAEPVEPWPDALAGATSAEKRARVAATLRDDGDAAAVLTLPDSICWLLNIRGSDIPRNPLALCFAILHADGRVELFIDDRKLTRWAPPEGVTAHDPMAFLAALRGLSGPVRVDPQSVPMQVVSTLRDMDLTLHEARDPCALPKARKSEAEIAATREAHLRDGAAMCEFLCWLDAQEPESLTEIDVVTALEGYRRATNALRDISFDTICGAGPHGAIVHYRVNQRTNRRLETGQLLLVDSGGQYLDGTTDITRTIALGAVGEAEKDAFTRVLRGMIGISRLRWPEGLAGRDLDAVARAPLWAAGLDFGHGTGHGVGVYMCVHEGPQRLARTGEVPFAPGMILSNEPGFYREGHFGIRIENLLVVETAPDLPGATIKALLQFETLTYVPIDRRLILPELLTREERDWLNAYHREVRDRIGPRLGEDARAWLDRATEEI